jgi:hypothetical protein
MTPEQLQLAWEALLDRVFALQLPTSVKTEERMKAFNKAYDDWGARMDRGVTYTSTTNKPVYSISEDEMKVWASLLEAQKTYVTQLEAIYPKKTAEQLNSKSSGKTVTVKDETVLGSLPWWYWPLRVGAGIGAGYFVFRVLRPKQGEFAFFDVEDDR